MLLLILVLGFFAQFIDGALGMGYGASSSSFLLAIGLFPAVISASVHTSEIFASGVSGLSHFMSGNVKGKIAYPLIITGVVGGSLGAYFLAEAPHFMMTPIVGVILLVLGARIFIKYFNGKLYPIGGSSYSRRLLLPLGLIGGLFDAIGGGGWGPICTSTLVSANKEKPHHVIGSVNVAEFFTTIAIVVTFGIIIGFENYLWFLVIPLILGGVVAAPVAAQVCRRIDPKLMGILVGTILVVLNTHTLVNTLPNFIGIPLPIHPELFTISVIGLMGGLTVLWFLQIRNQSSESEPSSLRGIQASFTERSKREEKVNYREEEKRQRESMFKPLDTWG